VVITIKTQDIGQTMAEQNLTECLVRISAQP